MDKKYVVYQHVTPDGYYYFGVTSNIKQRWRGNGYLYKTTALQPYIEKYGWDNIKHIVLFKDQTRENALFIENFLIETAREDGVCINKQRSGLVSKEEGYQQQKSKQYREQNKDKIREYYEQNKDKKREYNREYYEQNKDNIREQKREYRQQNKEKIQERKKQYYEQNKEQILEQKKQYYEQNKDKKREYDRQYRQRKKLEKQLKEVETTLF